MSNTYYEFEVELMELKPRIWRRFLLESSATFIALHEAIQRAFEWQSYHLYAFSAEPSQRTFLAGYNVLSDDEAHPKPTPLSAYFGDNTTPKSCYYLYDFGDDWLHKVTIKRVVELDERFTRRLLDGAQPAPIEDCGGVWGYKELLKEAKRGDEEAIELLSARPQTFDLKQKAKIFEQTSATIPLSSKKPQSSNEDGEVIKLLAQRMTDDPSLSPTISHALTRWIALMGLKTRPRKNAAIWAASLEYEATRTLGAATTQATIAKAYGVTAASISQSWTQIAQLIDDAADK